MNVSGVTLWSGQGLAIIAALAGLVFLLLGRRSAPGRVLVALTAAVALSSVLAGAQLIHLQPTHAQLSDSESTAPQSVVAPTDDTTDDPGQETGSLTGTEQSDPQTTTSDDPDEPGDSTKTHAAGRTQHGHDAGGTDGGQSEPSSLPAPPVATQPDPSPPPESSGTDADPATDGQ
jgi:hypothetical protein